MAPASAATGPVPSHRHHELAMTVVIYAARMPDVARRTDRTWLIALAASLWGLSAIWREPLAKYKTPQDYLISAFRALGQTPPPNQAVALATQLGQRPMTPGSPAGWPDIADHWTSGDALLKRIEWSTTLGATVGDRIDAVARLDEVLGVVAGEATRNAVRRAESGAQAVALLFAAPEFQRR